MDMSVMSIRDGPSEEPIQGSYSISQESPWTLKALIKFRLLNNKGTKWQTLAKIAARSDWKIPSESLFWLRPTPSVTVSSPCGVKQRASLVTSSQRYTIQAAKSRWNAVWKPSSWRDRGAIVKDLGVYLQYASNHPLSQFHVRLFPKPQRETLAGDSIFGLFATQTHNMVPPYQILLTITDPLGVKAVV